MLDLTRLRVLEAVARNGSVTAAARELNYAQPSVSHHLARLEAETGATLFQRAGRGIRLTDAGRMLAERAAEILGRMEAAETELAAQVGLRDGRVRLAAFPSALGTLVPAAAAAMAARHPGIDLMLTEAEPPEALRMLRAGYVDVAVIFRHAETASESSGASDSSGASEEAGTRGILLLEEPVYLVTPASAPAAGTDLAAYASKRWIAGCERCRDHLLRQCAAAGFVPKIAFTTDDFVAVQALVAAGLGVTTLPGLTLAAARHPGVRAEPLPGDRRQVYALVYGAAPDPPATSLLLEVLSAANTGGQPPARGGTCRPGPEAAA
ncbi:MAG TPA: LysR family transcriptional regulator [Streptosporangiaceae bacterium]|jgi:DNA-binding transcriptional LysR family regulator